MIIYPKNWERDYEKLSSFYFDPREIINELYFILKKINVLHLSYSGGIDSTIILHILSTVCRESLFMDEEIHTYTIASREDHPDIQFARKGSKIYNTTHHEFIVEPTKKESDKFEGDNAVRQLFELIPEFTDKIICCDGVDEFMCGYYKHQDEEMSTYEYYLSNLTPGHLIPLNNASKNVEVYLPFLDECLVDIYRKIPLLAKVDAKNRKKLITKIGQWLNIPNEFINRNKYGFCDAFLKRNKS